MANQYQKLTNKTLLAYIGTYTNGESEGIYICSVDMSSGELTLLDVVRDVENPSYLAIDAQRQRLYAVNELLEFGGRPGGGVCAFAIEPVSGELTFINQVHSYGGAPCYLTLAQTGRYLLVANYAGGTVAVIPVGQDGVLGKPTDIVTHLGSSQHPKRQNGPHPHSIVLDPANSYAFVPDLGLDRVMQYRFDRDNGRLIANRLPWIEVKAGSGPRHMVFHPNGINAYVINELSSTITVCAYDPTSGALEIRQTISTVPEDYAGPNIAADLHVAPSGELLFGSNRGHDSIAFYAVDQQTGGLTVIGFVRTQGKTPRGFVVDPTGTYLMVANQDSNNIATFRFDKDKGMIFPTGYRVHVPSPVCLKVAQLNGN